MCRISHYIHIPKRNVGGIKVIDSCAYTYLYNCMSYICRRSHYICTRTYQKAGVTRGSGACVCTLVFTQKKSRGD